jgi:L-lactate dehydrogenase complex protein LldG
MTDARQNILSRLRANRVQATAVPAVYAKPLGWDRERRIVEFTRCMQAVRGEVHRIARSDWVAWINQELIARGLHRPLVGRSAIAEQFAAGAAAAGFELARYDRPIEAWKQDLFEQIDFAVTGTVAGLAETGTLVLWPDADEPRLMSLVPPLHIAILEADRLYENFAELIQAQDWASGMPTNALLISGPSKTADIEQTLAFGIHGPKALITLIIE